MIQRTEEWYQARCGNVTASRLKDVLSKGKSRQSYMDMLLAERLTGQPILQATNHAMEHGIITENLAKEALELSLLDCYLEDVGAIPHPTIKGFLASPDSIMNGDTIIEIKCPNTQTHLQYLKTNIVPQEYLFQIYGQMVCTGLDRALFVSFDDRIEDENLQLLIIPVEKNPVMAKHIEEEVIKFLKELDEKEDLIRSRGQKRKNDN